MEENSLADLDHDDDDDDDDDVAGASRPAWSARWPDSCAAPADLSKDRIPALASEEHRLHKDHIASAPRLLVSDSTGLRLGPAGVDALGNISPGKVSEMFWFCGWKALSLSFEGGIGVWRRRGTGGQGARRERDREREREREKRRGANEEMNLAGTRVARAAAPGVRAARGRRGSLQVVAATTPQFKSTKHHHRSRPKKTRASEKNKKPTVYEPLPPPPPEFSVVSAKAKSSDE